MADPISAASGIVGLIAFGSKILSEGYAFVASAYRAPQVLRELLCEIAALDAVLYRFKSLVDEGADVESRSGVLGDLVQSGAITKCNESLLPILRSIDQCRQVKGQEVRNLGRRMMWPFRESEAKDALAWVSRIRGHLSAALTADMATTLNSVQQVSEQTSAGVKELQNWTAEQNRVAERKALLRWLNPTLVNADDNLKEGLEHRHPTTCEWVLETDIFKRWSAGGSSVLWASGIPGCGKTVLASYVTSTLIRQTSDPSHALVYFFCDRKDSNKRTLQQFLAVGLVQLISRHSSIPHEVTDLFQKKYHGDAESSISSEDRLRLFMTLLQNYSVFTIVIDALDECEELDEYVGGLANILTQPWVVVRIFVTGRYDYALQRALGTHAIYRIPLEKYVGKDIGIFIADEVKSRIQAQRLKVRSHELREHIIHVLSTRARGMFIWVTFQLDLISRLTNDKAIRDALHRLPRTLDNTYIQILEQIKEQHFDNLPVITKALMWIVSSYVPLTLGQLAEAISIEPGDTCRDLDKIMTDDAAILELLGGLVIVNLTQRRPFIRLAHFSLYEFLESETLQTHESLSMFHVSARFAFEAGAACAQYLSFSDFKEPCDSEEKLRERVSSYEFLTFAATEWTGLIRSSVGRGPAIRTVLSTMDWFLEPCRDGNDNFISWQQVYHGVVDCSEHPADPLAYAVEFRMVNLFDILLQRGASPAALYRSGYTDLHVAAIKGNEDELAVILQTNPGLETPVPTGLTPLHLAAGYGHAGAVKLLLEAGASPRARSDSGTTPLYRAARSGSVPTMELLHAAGGGINEGTWDHWTPIFEAIEEEHVDAVRWLVQKGAKLNAEMISGVSVLSYVKNMGNIEIVRIIEEGLARSTRSTQNSYRAPMR